MTNNVRNTKHSTCNKLCECITEEQIDQPQLLALTLKGERPA
jgi:hypothetical protein